MDYSALYDEFKFIKNSLSGAGNLKFIDMLRRFAPLDIIKVPSGTSCFDWTVPKEWNLNRAFIKNSRGELILDTEIHPLHVMMYSIPFKGEISKDELMKRIHTIEQIPDAIPYVTSYYKENWGFCSAHNHLDRFDDNTYYVEIDSTLEDGHINIAEGFIQGKSDKEIFFSTYTCHPFMANNEFSGPIVQASLYKKLLQMKDKLNYSYRFVFLPETIGSIAYLHLKGEEIKEKMLAGYVVTCVGMEDRYIYKRSRKGLTLTDRAAEHVLKHDGQKYEIKDFFPTGSDERQYCSLGFDLPVGSLTKTMYGCFPEYHTSKDTWGLVTNEGLNASVDTYMKIIQTIELNNTFINNMPYCEPQLGKRGLYPVTSKIGIGKEIEAIMYILAFSDGKHDLIDIADKAGIPAYMLNDAVQKLLSSELISHA